MSSFEPIRKAAIAEEITERFLSLIKDKLLMPGDRLPPERELAAAMQVSRPSLREALRALAMMNVVDTRQGDGTYVTSLEPYLLVEPLDFVISLDDSALHHLFEARRILEVGIASIAAERITDEQITALEEYVHASGEAAADPEAFLGVDLAIHELIVGAAANPLLKRIMLSLSHLGRASRRRTALMPAVRQRTVDDHHAIVAALKAHDADRAARAMTNHLDHIESSLA
ncbi:MAG TPA: FadR/GntR family transcriptional regulator [Anaerolineae bacterium]|nr:FadR/GntR family transcriptional regulator [Anaerolineae bacterium]